METGIYIRYSYIFNCGQNKHSVSVYNGYTREQGLVGEPTIVNICSRATDAIKGVAMTKKQLEDVKSLMRDRQDGIVDCFGNYYPY